MKYFTPDLLLQASDNLCTLFTDKSKMDQAERRALMESCRMRYLTTTKRPQTQLCLFRYATIPHSTACSDVAPATNPYGAKQGFSPGPRYG